MVVEAATCAGCISVAVYNPLYSFGGDAFGIVLHFYEDVFAVATVLFVEVEDGVCGSAGACEAIEDN